MLRSYLIALSFVNLCYALTWRRLLYLRQDAEFGIKIMPSPGEYAAAICGVLLLAALITGIDAFFRRTAPALQQLEPPMALVFLGMALQSLLVGTELRFTLLHFVAAWLLMCFVVATAVLALLTVYHRTIRRYGGQVLLAALPFTVTTFSTSIYKVVTRRVHSEPPHAALLPQARGPHVLWIIFDEWDQRLTFEARPPGLALPALDRLQGESFYAANALPPADRTIVSMPSLIEGRAVRSSTPIDSNTMLLEYKDGGKQRFGDEPNLFSEVRRAGMNAAVYGWYLPYCRVFAQYLSDCWWQEIDAVWNSGGTTFTTALLTQPRALFETPIFSPFGQSLTVKKHRHTYEELMQRSERIAMNPKVQFTLLHFSIPHPSYFYDRRSGEMTRANSPAGYPDSLALVDKTFATLRDDMERAGTWNSTTIVLSSDHFYRTSPLINGVRDRRVPFLVHFPGQSAGLSYTTAFNTLLTHDLILSLLHSEVTDAATAREWFNGHTGGSQWVPQKAIASGNATAAGPARP